MMDKRALLAIALTFLVIFFWGTIQSKFFPQPPADQPNKEVKKEEVAPAEKREVKPLKEEGSVSKPRVVIKKETSVETKNYLAVFTNEDASLKHFKLKQYEDRVEESSVIIKLIQFFQNLFGSKIEEPKKPKPLDLVNTNEEEGLPLRLIFQPSPDSGGWEVDKEKLQVLKAGENVEIVFSKSLDNGLKLLKKYRFTSENNVIDIEVEVQNTTSNEISAQLGLEWIGKVELEKFANDTNKDFGLKYAFMKDQKVERKDLGGVGSSGCTPGCGSPKKKVEPFESSDQGAIGWYAFEGEYFTALLVPPSSEKNIFLSVKGNDKNILKAQLATSPVSVPPRGAIRTTYRIYLGPKVIDSLKELGVGAEGLIDFGFFTIVAKPLLWFLKLTHTVTKNFGIDIIILSILIKIIFLPLTQISMKSMKEMQKVQPEMNRLKEQFKNDKARLQQETMLLYKRRKINPMSGCLPMLIQIPVFIALYNALQNSIEMRHAPFILWIMDLSAKDPIYITPIIMGATMVLQQKMTPTAADPAQAKIFMLMPIMFTFLFLNFPAGLVLYWMVTNILSIAHQYYMNKK
ncbi:MAG: membrane protein insertase YidC, partial [Deltaproteobacteria bacterium]|nr:membrane protein insertase YidC [Deltaproteobacteria bacterium]